MRIRLTRRLSRVVARKRHKRTHPVQPIPDQVDLRQAVVADDVARTARLHDDAARTVCATLEQMARREQDALTATPELESSLRPYFEASRRSLLHSTLAILDDQPLPQPARLVARRRLPWRRLPIRRTRKEHPRGTA